ncbi:hypothetical protein MC7420_4632 [Coleofasciculus chthonoplastes PCC 7420]|uniref:Uncharacterized protein n=1 Tax=Coleofasciculus chthonoplastes PCC 7420 TaxID=118168 RepID=B4VNT5_9CYAN|nr:hypothetical protein [Coleofasciculus chthonoplastes]EDX76376.1 hypothetical protein MC7420_4632 [Coleofasciculus chthonoplastes PCC 7420]
MVHGSGLMVDADRSHCTRCSMVIFLLSDKKEAVVLLETGYFFWREFNTGVILVQMLRFAKFCN